MAAVLLEGYRMIDYDAAVALMDDRIREMIHDAMPDSITEQEFLDRYALAHRAILGKPFLVD